jgi:hypothetical protein
MAAGLGLEPRFSRSERDVLPLDDPATCFLNFITEALSFFKSIGRLHNVVFMV